jgi:protein arginine kinase activator
MKCEICGRRNAVVFVQQISGGGKTEVHLCAECARENGLSRGEGDIARSVASLLASLPQTKKAAASAAPRALVCSACGTTEEELKKRGTAGCPACYRIFADYLFRKAYGEGATRRHAGRLPASMAARRDTRRELAALRESLAAAVQAEDYETAARCRDRVRALERDADDPA